MKRNNIVFVFVIDSYNLYVLTDIQQDKRKIYRNIYQIKYSYVKKKQSNGELFHFEPIEFVLFPFIHSEEKFESNHRF